MHGWVFAFCWSKLLPEATLLFLHRFSILLNTPIGITSDASLSQPKNDYRSTLCTPEALDPRCSNEISAKVHLISRVP